MSEKHTDSLIGIVIPAYNEEKTIGAVVLACKKHGIVIVVDDGSKDNTSTLARESGAIVLTQPVNMGVGFTTTTGNYYAIKELKCDIIVNIDADGQHSPDMIPELLNKINEGNDFVFGSRMRDNKDMPFIKKIGNNFITSFNNFIFGIKISDSQTGLRAFTRFAYDKLKLKNDGYSICSEFACEVGRNKIKYSEVTIKAVYDDWTKVKGTNVFHGLKIIYESILMKVR